MSHTKEFSILKWLVFPSLTLALAGVIAYFNVRVFGLEDGAPYIIVVGVLTGFSIAINKYIGSENVALARAAFILEIILALALAINAAYSFSVQRDMSIARQSEQTRSDDLKTISSLKSRTAQRDATKMIASNSGEVKSAQQIFADNERPLFWIMIAELLAYIVSAFTLLGISHLWQPKQRNQLVEVGHSKPVEVNYQGERTYRILPDGRRQIIQSTYSPDEVGRIVEADEDFPDELDASSQSGRNQSNLRSYASDANNATIATQSDAERCRVATQDGLAILRDTLSDVAFTSPGKWFKCDLRPDHVLVRLNYREQGREMTERSAKLRLDVLINAVQMPRDQFRARVKRSLRRGGFEI